MLQGTYFIFVESMPCKYRKALVFIYNYSIYMNIFCHTVGCIYVQWNRLCCDTQGIVII